MYILLVYKKELLKNDYLKTLLITILKSLKKKTYLKIIIIMIIIQLMHRKNGIQGNVVSN